jgi:hypothetical protein
MTQSPVIIQFCVSSISSYFLEHFAFEAAASRFSKEKTKKKKSSTQNFALHAFQHKKK